MAEGTMIVEPQYHHLPKYSTHLALSEEEPCAPQNSAAKRNLELVALAKYKSWAYLNLDFVKKPSLFLI